MKSLLLFWLRDRPGRLGDFYFRNQARLLLIVLAYLFLSVGSQFLKSWLGLSLSLNTTLFVTFVLSLIVLRISLSWLVPAALLLLIFAGLNLAAGNLKVAEASAVFAYAFLILGVLSLVWAELRSGNSRPPEE